jgi:hypothetical protein
MSSMPYLIRIRYTLIVRKLKALLIQRGIVDIDLPEPRTPLEFIRRNRLNDFDGRWAKDGNHEHIEKIFPYNATDADGKILTEGCFRFSTDYRGHVIYGQLFYALNNMWWIIAGDQKYNRTSGEFTSKFPGRSRVFRPDTRVRKIQAKINYAVKAEDYLQAAYLKVARDRLKENLGIEEKAA